MARISNCLNGHAANQIEFVAVIYTCLCTLVLIATWLFMPTQIPGFGIGFIGITGMFATGCITVIAQERPIVGQLFSSVFGLIVLLYTIFNVEWTPHTPFFLVMGGGVSWVIGGLAGEWVRSSQPTTA